MLTFDEQYVRLFVLVHIRIWMCCCLVTMIAIAHIYMQPHFNGDGLLTTPDQYWFRWNIRYIVMLTLDNQRVRLFAVVHIRIWICCCLFSFDDRNCIPACYMYTCNHTSMATAHISGLILISVEYTTHWYVDFGQTARTFIRFGAHLNLDVLLLV